MRLLEPKKYISRAISYHPWVGLVMKMMNSQGKALIINVSAKLLPPKHDSNTGYRPCVDVIRSLSAH